MPRPDILVRAREGLSVPRLSPDGNSVHLHDHASERCIRRQRHSQPDASALGGGPPQLVLEATGISNQQCASLPSTVCIVSRFEPGHERFFYFDPEKG